MAGAYLGKILFVDLTEGTITEEKLPDEIYEKYLGGYGLGAKICYDRIPKGADPLGPDNILGFCPGLLTGARALFAGRFMVVGKSPLTGGWGDANCGGYFAPEIKKAGFDGIFFQGVSKKPVYLLIKDDKIELKDAAHLWGKDALETEVALREELGDSKLQVATIGESGEKLSLISGIVNDRGRIAARSGLGAVMGSKKLKAVAIRGRGKVAVADRNQMIQLSRQFLERFQKGKFLEKDFLGKILSLAGRLIRILPSPPRHEGLTWKAVLRKYGTGGITAMAAHGGDSPVKNWKGSGYHDFPLKSSKKLSDEALLKHQVKKYNCINCPLGCGHIMKVEGGAYPLEETHKPEYESLCSFGALTLLDDLDTVMKLNDICNRAGIDTISCGAAVAFAIECFEKGLLTSEDAGGLHLRWGDGRSILQLTEKIISREGLGDVLADGVKRAAEKIGKNSAEFAIHAGGQELPMHDGRFDPGYAVGYECEPTPGRHTIISNTYIELMELDRLFKTKKLPMVASRRERFSPHGKAGLLVLNSKYVQVGNSAGLCVFGLQLGDKIPMFKWLNAATGWKLTDEDYMKIGHRIETIRQAFNVREGIKPKDFRMTARAAGKPPLTQGPNHGITLDMETLGRDFYKEYGWDYDTGMPLKFTLEQLGLGEVQTDLYPE